MSNFPGFQRAASSKVNTILPGDVYGGRTATNLGANGLFAATILTVGNAAFYKANGNQVASNTTDAGTSNIAGIVLRNQGLSPMGWADSQVGYSYNISAGSQASLGASGKFGAVITGVDTSGAANHVPLLGEQIWVKNTDGSFASAPSSVATVTGYTKANGWLTNRVGYYNATVTLLANQTLGLIVGELAGV